MKDQEVQLKVLALQASGGDLLKAKDTFAWLLESVIDAEVQLRLERIQATESLATRA